VVEPRTAAENDYTVDLAGDAEVNPALLYALHRQYGVDFDLDSTGEQLNARLGEIDSLAAKAEEAYRVLADLVGRQGLSTELEQRILAGIFSFREATDGGRFAQLSGATRPARRCRRRRVHARDRNIANAGRRIPANQP
jgi:hypothetical protein